jgi:hypothetical protein
MGLTLDPGDDKIARRLGPDHELEALAPLLDQALAQHRLDLRENVARSGKADEIAGQLCLIALAQSCDDRVLRIKER